MTGAIPSASVHRGEGRAGGQRGATRGELLLVLCILVVLVVVVVVSVAGIDSGVADRRCRSEQRQFKAAVEQYKAEQGTYPVNADAPLTAGYLASGTGADAARDWDVALGTDQRPVFAASPDGRCA